MLRRGSIVWGLSILCCVAAAALADEGAVAAEPATQEVGDPNGAEDPDSATPEAEEEAADVSTAPDLVVTGGQMLRGEVLNLDDEGVTFQVAAVMGEVKIAWDDLEDVATLSRFQVFWGEEDELVTGRLVGVAEGTLLVGPDADAATGIPVAAISAGISEAQRGTIMDRWRARYPWWRAELDAGAIFEQGAVDKVKLNLNLDVERRRRPWRMRLLANAAFETQEKQGGPRVTTKDEYGGSLFGERDIRGRIFGWGLLGAESDQPRRIDIRAFPGFGLGYRFFDSNNALLQLQAGPGWVYEKFSYPQTLDLFGQTISLRPRSVENNYLSAMLIAEGFLRTWRDIELRGLVLYVPGLAHPDDDWLWRFEFSMLVPIVDPLALRLRITEVLDNNPAPNVGNNKFTTALALVLRF